MNWVEAAGYLASAYRCHRQQYCFHHLWVLRQRTPCPGAARDLAAAECLARYSDASLDKAGGGGLQRLYRTAKAVYERSIPESWRNNFNKGDYADRLYMIIAGDIHLEQIDHILRAGDLFGEIGLFSADHQRIQAARTMTDVHLLWISERELAQISYQNPGMAFYFLRLTTNRLIANASRVETVEATLLAPS